MDEDAIDALFYSLLESTGGIRAIKRAIQTKDKAAIVKAAIGALRGTLSIPMVIAERKSADMSKQFRREGNICYINGNFKDAIVIYNKSVAYAPINSPELALAYSNISAVLFAIKAFRDCVSNIKAAQESNCPQFLEAKLKKRQMDAEKFMMLEMIRGMTISDEDMLNYTKFEVMRNVDIPCVSTDVCVDEKKHVVAAKDIKSGTIVALERAFVTAPDDFKESTGSQSSDSSKHLTSCYFCNKMCLFLIPCEGCCKALFCSKECREKCLEEYHRIECHIVPYMGTMYKRCVNKMAVRAAIKISLKLSWEELRTASMEMGEQRLVKASVNEAFDSNKPLSMLCYNDQVTVPYDVMIHSSLICAAAIHCLDRTPNYLPEGKENRDRAIDALSRIMLHLRTTFLRTIKITSSSYDYLKEANRCGVQRNEGWFSFASKLAHSCEPNLLVLGFNDSVGLVALRRIKKGDPLSISFTEHFYETILSSDYPTKQYHRQLQIYNHLQFKCQCRVCLLEWHSRSQVLGLLSNRQKAAFNRYKIAMNSGSFKQEMKAIGEALDELSDCINTTQHLEVYEDLRRTLNICQCARDSNRSYGCVSRYIFMIKP